MDNKDIRVLCAHCIEDYIIAGYEVIITSHIKEPCDKCDRQGFECELIKP